ncbi:MAG: bacillithiol biosynthesis cysteine-adding enzyme BshC [Sphingobacteriales bacterium]|jgi:bacillithiol biosynthesis cysteine-adding enzyme BshC
MKTKNQSLTSLSFLSPLISDYLFNPEKVEPFFEVSPSKKEILTSIKKKQPLSQRNREVLVNTLIKQYENLDTCELTKSQINRLADHNTYTITTGHQLNFATGPLYVVYKILSTINAAEELSKEHKDIHVVPVFWMATEDHDFDEINHCNLLNNKVSWVTEKGNATGRLSTAGISSVIESEIRPLLEKFPQGEQIIALLKDAYDPNNSLGKATFQLFHSLFDQFGLVILDPDHRDLKALFAPIVKKELLQRKSKNLVEAQNLVLQEKGYKVQAHAREINLFLLRNNKRDRIIFEGNAFHLAHSNEIFSEQEVLDLVDMTPEAFSPNVILRPVYQECILPNLAYIGGAGELAYWLQLKTVFELYDINFPSLMLRNMGVIIQANQLAKMNKLEVTISDLFKSTHQLTSDWVRANSSEEIDFDEEKKALQLTFDALAEKANKIDPTLNASIAGNAKSWMKDFNNLEKKLMKAAKNKSENSINQLTQVQEQLFPQGFLQERYDNIFGYIAKYGFSLIGDLKSNIKPFESEFTSFEV